jgi:phosphoribosylformylglycinamidine synthase
MIYCIAVFPRQAQAGFSDSSNGSKVESRNRLYLLEFEQEIGSAIARNALQTAASHLFADPVIEKTQAGEALEILKELPHRPGWASVMTAYRPGVTDSTGESALRGYRVLVESGVELPSLKRVRTAEVFYLKEDDPDYVRSHLINELVQESVPLEGDVARFLEHQFHFEHSAKGLAHTIPLREATDTELERISKEGLLALNLAEMKAIQDYYRQEQRDPTDIELETLAQTWSEHCVHKTFKARIDYTEYDPSGKPVEQQEIDGLFKSGIAAPTKQLDKPWVVSAFVDNAGIIAFDRYYDLSFKAETHNHPSALEPFGGANTGLGGVIRDIMAVSAKPIANTDVFCFGLPDTDPATLPSDVLPPWRVFDGVVNGVRDYGNKMGIPTVNGAVLFDFGYVSNPLVFCGTVGLAPHGSHPRNVKVGDRVVVVGGRTGRDGIHGATFSSIELGGEEVAAEAGSVVQIGNPIVEKKVLDLILKARDLKLYNAITDCGGGGLSSAIGEMGQETGVRVELEKVPLKYAGLEPWEIWISEAQERMLLAIPPENLPEFLELCRVEEVEATDLGEFTGDALLTLNYRGHTVGQLKMDFLHNGLPRRRLQARWQRRAPRPRKLRAHYEHHRPYQGYGNILMKLLSDPNIASKEQVIRLYDHEVQGGTVVKPLVGQNNDGPGDAAVVRPLPGSKKGIVISNGINPRYGLLDPYHMAACAIDEAVRNAVAVGADLRRMALLDNFCWGNPNVPERLGELTRAVMACRDYSLAFGLPFISGKDSLNNEFFDPATGTRIAIPGTLLVSAISVMPDASKAVTMDLKQPGNLLYLVGKTRPELGASYYSKYHGQVEGEVPKVEAGSALRGFRALSKAVRLGLVRSCHDLSEGGLAVAAAEMAIAGGYGMRLNLIKVPYDGSKADRTNAALMFSETPSRFLVEVSPEYSVGFEKAMQGVVFARVGSVLEDDEFTITGLSSATVLRQHVADLKKAWQTPLFN